MASSIEINLIKRDGLTVTDFNVMPPRTSSGESKDLDEFLNLINLALETQFDRDSTPKDKRLKLKAAWPQEQRENPGKTNDYVVARVVSRKRANYSPTGERRPQGKLIRQYAQHPNKEDQVVEVSVQERDNIIEFEIMSADPSRANNWALWFEKFMQAWTFYFRDMGINELFFEERKEDKLKTIGGTDVYVRPIQYFVRTQVVSQAFFKKIDEINIRFDSGLAEKKEIVNEEYEISNYSIYEPDFRTQEE